MAEAKKSPAVEETVTLTLTPDEARTLWAVGRHVAGPMEGPRGAVDRIREALGSAGYTDRELSRTATGGLRFPLSEPTPLDKPETRTPQVGDRVRVVEDDPRYRSGEFIGRIGRVKSVARTTGVWFEVEFGTGTGRCGDSTNGTWYVKRVEVIESAAGGSPARDAEFSVGDYVTFSFSPSAIYRVACIRPDGRVVSTQGPLGVSPMLLTRIAGAGVDTVDYEGETYVVPGRYRDRDGDVWRFERINGVVRGATVSNLIDDNCHTLSEVASNYGPLRWKGN
ncbi:phiSA1p31-related protein [Streptomyces sp. SM12]|uniref:phiSA1p31-related protein n=1 Tax=Streptomyces sp. SM12 TaxID=1071602 RepID=UPI000CD4D2A0|nr:phiSA1p31-related protein [Streptomyces sp. SM12]